MQEYIRLNKVYPYYTLDRLVYCAVHGVQKAIDELKNSQKVGILECYIENYSKYVIPEIVFGVIEYFRSQKQ